MMTEQRMADPDPAEIRAALESVLANETFRSSPQLAAFLRFVVEAALRGEGHRLKGYTIGVEALGRPQSFDPQIDPIVRVEATRLRRTLERYYAGPGAADPIVFELSRGSYLPAIRRRNDAPRPETAVDAPPRPPRRAFWLAAVTTTIAVAACMIVLAWPNRKAGAPGGAGQRETAQTFDGPLRPGNGMPTLLIETITIKGPPSPSRVRNQTVFAMPLTERLRAAFARFDTLKVVGEAADENARTAIQPDYRLIGTGELEDDNSARGRFRLVDTLDGSTVWSQEVGPFPAERDQRTLEDSIVRDVTMKLAQPFGVIRARERARHLATGIGDPRYRCVVEASESFRSFSPAQHARARECLESLIRRDPSFAMGFAYLAAVYTREFQYGIGIEARPDAELLDRALTAARQGVELNPESARAYQMLATVLFARGETASSFAASEKAIALNPNDMTILSDYGGRLIVTGEIDRGTAMLARAADDTDVRPSWYHFYLFLAAYMKNDFATATRHSGLITTDTYPLGLLAHALVAASDGNRDLARQAFGRLAALRPAWSKEPRDELNRLFPAPLIADRLARDLSNAGLAPIR